MDILSHTLTGIAVSTALLPISNTGLKGKIAIICAGGLGGIFPDLDVISLWSKFDVTIGKLFNLSHTGKEIYSAKFWYSHHAFLHSVAAGLLLTLLIGMLILKVKKITYKELFTTKRYFIFLLVFITGFIFHLLQDMPTPSSTWNGVRFFWPIATYTGGTGKIWWWNNYDIFLIIVSVIFINFFVLILIKKKQKLIFIPVIIFGLGLIFSMYQVNTRAFDFNYNGNCPDYSLYEQKSKELQEEILGKKLYKFMKNLDNKLPFYF